MLDLPVEYALVAFKGNKFTGKIVPELLALADKGIVRFVDIVFIRKDKDGSLRTVELNDLEPQAYKEFVPLGKHVQSLFTEDDLEYAASKLPKNTSAAFFLWENLWTTQLRKAVAESGGEMIERGQIPADVVKQFKKDLAAAKRQEVAPNKKSAAKKKSAGKKK